MHLETEIKYRVRTFDGLSLGSLKKLASGFEKNSYMDFDTYLADRGNSLRIREFNKEVIVTLKEKGISKNGIKSRPETNITMQCPFMDAVQLFLHLGAKETGYYEKQNRTIYRHGDCFVCLDTIFDRKHKSERRFVEIEGPNEDAIFHTSRIIGINGPKLLAGIVSESYKQMFATPWP